MPPPPPPPADVDLDAILDELKPFGRYQARSFALILLPIIFSAVYISQHVFAADDVPYRCLVEECELDPPQWSTDGWGEFALVDRCTRRVGAGGACQETAFGSDTEPCGSWLYQSNHTIVAEFSLACQSWKRTLVGSVHSAGMFVALPLTGLFSDAFGRRAALIFTAVAPAPMGLLRSIVPNYSLYLLMEFAESLVGTGVYTSAYVLALEMVRRDKRVLAGNLIPVFFALGQALLALTAWQVPYWRHLLRWLYAPSFIFLLYYFCLPESVRWLLSKGRRREAVDLILKAAAMDKVKLSPKSMAQLEQSPEMAELPSELKTSDPDIEEPRSLTWQLLHSRMLMMRLCLCSFWWVTMTFVYYGLSINSVALGGSRHANFILSSLVELPGYLLSVLTLDRFGRRNSIMVAFSLCGTSLLLLPLMPDKTPWARTGLSLAGKMFVCMASGSLYIFTSELFPTRARHTALALCSMVGRGGQMLAPMTPLLVDVWAPLPYALFGSLAAAAALLLLAAPETLHRALPDTVKQAEALAARPLREDARL